MKPVQPKKKYIPTLPKDFQEVLMTTEMELHQGLNVPILRKLVYLYTRAMQYYDLSRKEKFREFYSDKLVSLLTRKDVEQFLDKNPINFDDQKDLDLLFPPKEQKKENKIKNENDKNEELDDDIIDMFDNEMIDFSQKVRKNSMTLVKKKINDFDIRLFVKKKLLQVNANLNKIDQALSNEMIEQMTEFEENKRKRKVMKSNNNITDNNENIIKDNEIIIEDNKKNEEDKNNESITSHSSNDESSNSNSKNMIKSVEDEIKILQLSGINISEKQKSSDDNTSNNNTPTKNLIGNNPMLREIEDYVQKNMDEMYKAFEELKASFQEEINEAEENGFTDIAEGLKEDLKVELDNLKDQYEEQRRVETEKIKAKYSKRNSVMIS
jgi:hypothetical protein